MSALEKQSDPVASAMEDAYKAREIRMELGDKLWEAAHLCDHVYEFFLQPPKTLERGDSNQAPLVPPCGTRHGDLARQETMRPN